MYAIGRYVQERSVEVTPAGSMCRRAEGMTAEPMFGRDGGESKYTLYKLCQEQEERSRVIVATHFPHEDIGGLIREKASTPPYTG